ncbi:MAG: SpoIIE family protein phosphatase [Lachnospiraceae bacterium]
MKESIKRIGIFCLLYLISIPVCTLSFGGCHPLIPVYATVMYENEKSRKFVLQMMLLELFLLLPVTEMVKYGMILVCILCGTVLLEKVLKKCNRFMISLFAAVSTALIGWSGQAMQIQPQKGQAYLVILLESVFVGTAGFCGLQMPLAVFRQKQDAIKFELPAANESKQRKLGEYAQSFQKLSGVFSRMEEPKQNFTAEDFQQMQEEVTGKICYGCSQCALCWESQKESGMTALFQALFASMKKAPKARQGLEQQLQEFCIRTPVVLEEMMQVFERASLNLAWYNRLLENREAIAQQLNAMVDIMQDCMEQEKDISKEQKNRLWNVYTAFKQEGVLAQDLSLVEKENGRWQLKMYARTKAGNFRSVKELAQLAGKALKREMVAQRDTKTLLGKEKSELIFEEAACFQELHGVARVTKEGAAVSGDTFSVLQLEDGKVVYGLSDGMGSGARACRESELVIELTERFLEAGFSIETALRMMNSTMVLHGENDQFSTVDLAEVNLYDGSLNLYKIGAAATFIGHKKQYSFVESDTLPTGVTCHLQIKPKECKLRNGDKLVMVTDGVLECLESDQPEETMCELLSTLESTNPKQIARQILQRVLLQTGGHPKDDMTVLCVGIWEK